MNAFRGPRRRRRIGSLFTRLGRSGWQSRSTMLVPAAAGADVDPRLGLTAGWLDAGSSEQRHGAARAQRSAGGFFQRDQHRVDQLRQLRHRLQRQVRVRGQLPRVQHLRHHESGGPGADDVRRLPRRPGRHSVFGNLLFMSVEETRGRIDCGTQGRRATTRPLPRRPHLRHQQHLRADAGRGGTDLPWLAHPHARHEPGDTDNVYVYVSGTAGIRLGGELAGCSGNSSHVDPIRRTSAST